MNKIQSACIFQTILFSQPSETNPNKEETVKANKGELERYLKNMDALHVRYQVTDEKIQPDGSILVKIRKQQDYVTDVKSYFKK